MITWETSLTDFAARLERQGSRRAPLAPRTRTAYLKDVRALAAWIEAHGIAAPARITPSVLAAALRALGWSPATQARALTATKEWLAPLFPPGRSPAERLERPRVSPPLVPRLSQADAQVLVESIDAAPAPAPGVRGALERRDRAVLEVLYGSALRRQELCDLILPGLDFEHETVRVVGKGNKARTVPLTEPAVEALGAWLREGRPLVVDRSAAVRNEVFLSVRGRPLDGSAVYRIVAPRLRAMGRAGGPHLLRHAAATHLLEGHDRSEGAHLRVVQEVLGHASLATTQRYTGVTTKDIQRQLRRGHPRG
jgi:integrase/recombinase XerC